MTMLLGHVHQLVLQKNHLQLQFANHQQQLLQLEFHMPVPRVQLNQNSRYNLARILNLLRDTNLPNYLAQPEVQIMVAQ